MALHPLYGSPDVFEVSVPVATLWSGPDAPRDVDRDTILDQPDLAAWTASMDAATRKGLDGRTLTQLLMGEGVQVVEDRGDWVRVRVLLQPSSQDLGGYPGWLRKSHLGAPVARTVGPTAFVMSPVAVLQIDDGTKEEISSGTGFWVDDIGEDSVRVCLPGDRFGTVTRPNVRLSDKRQQPAFGPLDLLGHACQFVGLRYLWGGTSSWGLDCSGLVHLTYRAHGIVVPRDASDQADEADPVPLHQVQPGDLYFFARPGELVYHVGFATSPLAADGTRTMLHAPESGEFIEDAPLAPHRAETLVSAGRIRDTRKH